MLPPGFEPESSAFSILVFGQAFYQKSLYERPTSLTGFSKPPQFFESRLFLLNPGAFSFQRKGASRLWEHLRYPKSQAEPKIWERTLFAPYFKSDLKYGSNPVAPQFKHSLNYGSTSCSISHKFTEFI